jgi:iron complex outermembrane recepter protein
MVALSAGNRKSLRRACAPVEGSRLMAAINMRGKTGLWWVTLLGVILAASSTVIAAPTSQPTTAPSPSDENDLTKLSLEDLMNVQVTSVSKEPEKLADAPAAVSVIGQDDMQRSGLDSIPELLRLAPGMDVTQINGSHWAISARGVNGDLADNLLVLMDGRSLYTPTFGGVFWKSVDYPIFDLDRIEVIDGPGSTLWGSNAVNGVVNIISKSSKDTQGLIFDARGGTQQDIGTVRYGGQISDNTFYRVYSQYQYTGEGVEPNGDAGHDEWQGMQSGFRIDRYSTPDDTLTLQGDVFWNQEAETSAPLPAIANDTSHENGGDVLGRWTHVESDRADTSLQVYYDRQANDETPLSSDQDSFDVEFQNRFPIGNIQEVTWGLGGRDQLIHFSPLPSDTVSPTSTNEYIYNGFLQDQITLIPDRLQWFAGSKLEYNNLTNLEVQPSTRLLWTPDERNSVWGAVSRSVRLPSVYQESNLNYQAFTTGTQNPNAEQSWSYEIGYKVQPIKTVTMDVTGFYNNYTDLIVPIPNLTAPAELDYGNGANAQSFGGELSANWQVMPNWRLAASYSYLMVKAQAQNKTLADQFIPPYEVQFIAGSSPQNQFQIHSYLDILKDVQFNSSLYYVDALKFINRMSPIS